MASTEQTLSSEQNELVAVGASVRAGCRPCVDRDLKAGASERARSRGAGSGSAPRT